MSHKRLLKVILVDDHILVRRGVAALLEMEGSYQVVAEAENGEEMLQLINSVSADIAILDLSLPRLNGIETTRRIGRQNPELKILILSMYDDEAFVIQAMQAGALGYILKQSMEDELFEALIAIREGDKFISSNLSFSLPIDQENVMASQLTSREHEILELIVEGNNTSEIAEILKISPHTASRHRANLMQKLAVHTQAGLVRTAIERGLIILKKPPHSQ